MSLLTLSVSLPGLKPSYCSDSTNCKKASAVQLAVFFGALYALAIGTSGTKSNISTIGADQFDEFEPKEKAHKLSFFHWWLFSIFFGTLFANTILVYIQDNVGWTLGHGIPTAGLALSILIFLVGSPFYRHKVPSGSPFTRMARYFVKIMERWAKNPRGITFLQRMGVRLVLHIFIMLITSLTKTYRLKVAKDHGLVESGGQVPQSIFILLPQFVLMGTADAFLEGRSFKISGCSQTGIKGFKFVKLHNKHGEQSKLAWYLLLPFIISGVKGTSGFSGRR
ncbi:hypothetical protein RHMOL_Rhmol04G0284100 [Rhododendron molle]|uniref:Uncharacterized protein n=1 Tax=Rhododendron molle TaxID=49168 RepID=A0ACC0P5H6_RHOML|nr:hypothetical protein RHMOL_Rhmol04G0284100 [Rhododendron molle]